MIEVLPDEAEEHRHGNPSADVRLATMPFAICDFGRTQNLVTQDAIVPTFSVGNHQMQLPAHHEEEFENSFDNHRATAVSHHVATHTNEELLMPYNPEGKNIVLNSQYAGAPGEKPAQQAFSYTTNATAATTKFTSVDSDIDRFFRRQATISTNDEITATSKGYPTGPEVIVDTTEVPSHHVFINATTPSTLMDFDEGLLPTGGSSEEPEPASLNKKEGVGNGSSGASGCSSSTVTITAEPSHYQEGQGEEASSSASCYEQKLQAAAGHSSQVPAVSSQQDCYDNQDMADQDLIIDDENDEDDGEDGEDSSCQQMVNIEVNTATYIDNATATI